MKKEREAVLIGESKYRRLIKSLENDFIFYSHGRDGVFTYLSPSIKNILGYSQKEFLTHYWEYMTENPVNEKVCSYTELGLQGEEQPPYEVEIFHKNGSIHQLEVKETPIFDSKRKVVAIDGIARDITERKQEEEALRAKEADLSRAQKIAHLGSWVWEIRTNELRWSDEVYRIFGLKPQEFGATYEAFLNSVHPDDREFVDQSVRESLENKKPYDIEYRIIRPDGEERFVHEQSENFYDEEGKPLKMMGTVLDITERKLAEESLKINEEQLKRYANELERSNNELENFASIASHDLQEPLRKIVSFGDLLSTRIPETDEQGRNYLNRMQNSALRMRSLVEDLLQYTKIETKIRPFEATDLNKVAQTVLEDLEARLKESEGVLNINNLPIIEADPVQMYQLFLNLIGNALKFNREGIPPVVKLDSAKKDNGFWEISVEDNGIGIEEEHVDRIFKPFERLHGRSTYEGTGIGLTICNKIVSRHGGKITVKRQSTNGITFHITLPEKQSNAEMILSKPSNS